MKQLSAVCRLLTFAVAACAAPTFAWSASIDLVVTANGKRAIAAHQTLDDAVRAARAAKAKSPAAGVAILLGSGDYSITAPITLGPDLSGTAAAPTRIAAKPGAKPEIRASRALKLNWRPHSGNIWVAKLDQGDFDQLWIGGERQVLARYPNYDPKILPLGGYAADALSTARAARWSHPEDGAVRAIHRSRWGGVVFRITGKDASGKVLLGAPLANNRILPPMDQPHAQFRFVEGLFEELDAPNEWFFDRREGALYYIPAAGTDLTKAKVEVSTTDEIFRIVGDRKTPVHDILLEGLSFSRARDTIFQATEPLLRSDWKIARKGAIFIQGAERVSILNSDFHDLGGQGVFVSGYARNVAIRGNAFWDMGGTPISFVGFPSAARSPNLEYNDATPLADLDRTPGPLTDDYPADSIADDNLIHDIGRSDKQAAGVEIATAMSITVSRNSIYTIPRSGINIGDGTWGGHILEHNDVFDTVLETGDHGAFNSWGRDRFWRADRKAMDASVAAEPTLPYLDVIKPIIIRNNRFQSDHGWDIDLDDGASNYDIYNNVLLTGGLKLREGFGRRVSNNIMINSSLHPHVWFKDSGDRFERNIVMGPYQPILMPHWSKDIDFNLFADKSALADAQKLGLDANSRSGEPGFINAAKGDYRVAPNSPALALGFRNFDMTFGVQSPRLVTLARKPTPPAILLDLKNQKGATADFYGATVKSVETEGEKSATGLPDISGVMVLAVKPDTAAARAGLQAGDVILGVAGQRGATRVVDDAYTRNLSDLFFIAQSRKWQGAIRFLIQRNQSTADVEVRM